VIRNILSQQGKERNHGKTMWLISVFSEINATIDEIWTHLESNRYSWDDNDRVKCLFLFCGFVSDFGI